MKKAIVMFLVIVLSLFVISACNVENEESGAGATSDNSSVVSDTSEANSSEEESTELIDVSITETSEDTSIPEETSEDTSIPEETSEDTSIPEETSEDTSIPEETSEDTSIPEETSEDTSVPEETSEDTSDNEIASQIYAIFDTIFANDNDHIYESEGELIEAFPNEFATIVSIGEDSYPVLLDIINDSESSNIKKTYAQYLKSALSIELYNRTFTSPDGKYTLKPIPDSHDSTLGDICHFELVDNETGTTMATTEGGYYYYVVRWSPNSRYAAVKFGNSFFKLTHVIDFQELKTIELLDEKEIESIIQDKFNNDFSIYSGYFGLTYEEWVDDDKIKIKVKLQSPLEYEGWYIYDLSKNKIIEENISEK